MFIRILQIFLVFCLAATSAGVLAKHKPKMVDCDKETDDQGKLQKAIDKAKPGTTILVEGTCNGVSLVIAGSGVTLQGPADLVGTGAAPVVRVQDSGDVSLLDLDVSNGISGVEAANSRVTATNVIAHDNLIDGFSVIQNSALVCVDCQGNDNGDRGMLVIGSVTLCGDSQFRNNVNTGWLVFLGGRIFSNTAVCGARPGTALSGNPSGITLFEDGNVFFDEVDLHVSGAITGINVIDGSVFTARRSHIELDGNAFAGLNIQGGSTVRLNDDAPSTAGGSTTSIQNNAIYGVLISQNSQVSLGNATVLGNPLGDLLVQDFSIANVFGVSDTGFVSCEPGQSAGNLCP